jgi:hypothetical protein
MCSNFQALHSRVGCWPYPKPLEFRLGQKGLPGTNTLAYSEHSQNYGYEKFYNIGYRYNVIKRFTAAIYKCSK